MKTLCSESVPGNLTVPVIEGFGKEFAHNTCKGCHATGKGPTSCKDCHK